MITDQQVTDLVSNMKELFMKNVTISHAAKPVEFATFVAEGRRYAVGQTITCMYAGKARIGRIDKIYGHKELGSQQVSIETGEGYRRFTINGMSAIALKS